MTIAKHTRRVEIQKVAPDLGATFDAPASIEYEAAIAVEYEACAERQLCTYAPEREQWIIAIRALQHQRLTLGDWFDENQLVAAEKFATASLEVTWGDPTSRQRSIHWGLLHVMPNIVTYKNASEDLPRDFIPDPTESDADSSARHGQETKTHFVAWDAICYATLVKESIKDARDYVPPAPQWAETHVEIIDLALRLQARDGPGAYDDLKYDSEQVDIFRKEAAALLDVTAAWQMPYNPAV